MEPIEWKIRRFRAAFFVSLQFANWVRTRGRELTLDGRAFEIVLCWGKRRFRVGHLPEGDPYFALEHPDGTLERSPWF